MLFLGVIFFSLYVIVQTCYIIYAVTLHSRMSVNIDIGGEGAIRQEAHAGRVFTTAHKLNLTPTDNFKPDPKPVLANNKYIDKCVSTYMSFYITTLHLFKLGLRGPL